MSAYSVFSITSDIDLNTVNDFDYFLIDASGGNITITLPNASSDGLNDVLRRTDTTFTNTVTVQGFGGQTLNGAVSLPLHTNMDFDTLSFGGNWTVDVHESFSTANVPPTKTAAGTIALVGGTATVSTTLVRTSSVITLTAQVVSGTPGILTVGTRVAGTSFVINSTSGTDTSTVGWLMHETA